MSNLFDLCDIRPPRGVDPVRFTALVLAMQTDCAPTEVPFVAATYAGFLRGEDTWPERWRRWFSLSSSARSVEPPPPDPAGEGSTPPG